MLSRILDISPSIGRRRPRVLILTKTPGTEQRSVPQSSNRGASVTRLIDDLRAGLLEEASFLEHASASPSIDIGNA